MRPSRRLLTTLSVAAALALPAVFAAFASLPPQSPRLPRAVVTDTDAFVLGEPRLIAAPRLLDVVPSPDGPYALVVRTDRQASAGPALDDGVTNSALELLLWNRRTGRVTPMWREEARDGATVAAVFQSEWLPGRNVALVTLYRGPNLPPGSDAGPSKGTVLLLDVRAARARPIAEIDGDTLLVSPESPYAVLTQRLSREEKAAGKQPTFRVIRPNGTVTAPVPLKADVTLWPPIAADGSAMYAVKFEGRDEKGRVKQSHYSVSLATGVVTPVTGEPRQPDPAATAEGKIDALPVMLRSFETSIKREDGSKEALNAVYLALRGKPGDKPATPAAPPAKDTQALVATDAEAVTLLPDGSAALYRSRGGALWAVPITRQDRDAFLNARRDYYRQVTMQNAKQVGLALVMYTQDYDEFWPNAGGNIRDQIGPYLRTSTVLQNPETGEDAFTFVHPGVAGLAGVKEPAKTTIGYVGGPGGRAVIYADGHVGWEDR
jgi:hypothetical protein